MAFEKNDLKAEIAAFHSQFYSFKFDLKIFSKNKKKNFKHIVLNFN